jgi:heme-degrading monooxygenase HmoA
VINYLRIGIYKITQGSYEKFVEQSRQRLTPFHRESPGFVFYSLAELDDGRVVSASIWEKREQAEAAASMSAEWIRSANLADSVVLEENLIGEMTTLAAIARRAV